MATELGMLKAVFLSTIIDHAAWKWMIGLCIGVSAFLFPSEALARCAYGVFGLICLDWFTGILATVLTGRKFTKHKARKGAIRMLGYILWIVLVALAAASLPEVKGAHTFLLSLTLGHIGWTELVSVVENLSRMGTPLPEAILDALKAYRAKKDKRDKETGVSSEEESKL